MNSVTVLLLICAPTANDVRVVARDGEIIGTIDGQPVLTYHITPVDVPNATEPTYLRSGFVHPLRTRSGVVVTDDFSPDHPHQNGLFSTWVRTSIDGRRVDFWNQHKKLGTFRHAELVSIDDGDGAATFTVVIEHVDRTNPAGPTVALNEQRSFTLRTVDDFVVVDVHGLQRCATSSPVVVHEYHYGGAAMRGARHWTLESGAGFRTSGGQGRDDGNHVRSSWMQLYGPAVAGEDELASLTAISHPGNFRYPEPVRLHPTMPYSVFSPCVLGEFQIEPGRPLEMRYRYVIADGRPSDDVINKLAVDFAADDSLPPVRLPD